MMSDNIGVGVGGLQGNGSAPKSSYILRCRGLPWASNKQDVRKFFGDLSKALKDIYFTYNTEGRPNGEAYVEFSDEASAKAALKMDHEKIGQRYIEIFESDEQEMGHMLLRKGKPASGILRSNDEGVVRMRGLPYGCSKEEIINFFRGLVIIRNGIVIPCDKFDKPTGEAFVQFVDSETVDKALEKHMQHLGSRYIEVFRSSTDELQTVMKRLQGYSEQYMGQEPMRMQYGSDSWGPGGGGGGIAERGGWDRNESAWDSQGMNPMGGGGYGGNQMGDNTYSGARGGGGGGMWGGSSMGGGMGGGGMGGGGIGAVGGMGRRDGGRMSSGPIMEGRGQTWGGGLGAGSGGGGSGGGGRVSAGGGQGPIGEIQDSYYGRRSQPYPTGNSGNFAGGGGERGNTSGVSGWNREDGIGSMWAAGAGGGGNNAGGGMGGGWGSGDQGRTGGMDIARGGGGGGDMGGMGGGMGRNNSGSTYTGSWLNSPDSRMGGGTEYPRGSNSGFGDYSMGNRGMMGGGGYGRGSPDYGSSPGPIKPTGGRGSRLMGGGFSGGGGGFSDMGSGFREGGRSMGGGGGGYSRGRGGMGGDRGFKAASSSDAQQLAVKMRGLPFTVTEQEVDSFFQPIRIRRIELLKEPKMNRPSGEAMVEFYTHSDAVRAMDRDKQHIGTALLALLLSGYVAQKYLPPPPPRIVGIDLGTTFSSIGVYHAITGEAEIIPDEMGRRSIPSVVAFIDNGTVLYGHAALAQSEKNLPGTLYDAKRFIGKTFIESDEQFQSDRRRYPFQIELSQNGSALFVVPAGQDKNGGKSVRRVSPEEVGSIIISNLRKMAENSQDITIKRAVISVPAEFNEDQRNATRKAASLAGLEVLRIISEPTAAALAYGLHNKKGVEYILVVDLGGGTLDVSLLWLQNGMFVTVAMAGNNRLGGQDFNERILQRLLTVIREKKPLTDPEDIQNLRSAVESAKLRLTYHQKTIISLNLHTWGHFKYELTRKEFESLNEDLLMDILEPVKACLVDGEVTKEDIDEIVLVGGSTRIPRVRSIVGEYFRKPPNFGVDPDLAVVTGVTVQAGVLGGAWPLTVSATELASNRRKIHIYSKKPVSSPEST